MAGIDCSGRVDQCCGGRNGVLVITCVLVDCSTSGSGDDEGGSLHPDVVEDVGDHQAGVVLSAPGDDGTFDDNRLIDGCDGATVENEGALAFGLDLQVVGKDDGAVLSAGADGGNGIGLVDHVDRTVRGGEAGVAAYRDGTGRHIVEPELIAGKVDFDMRAFGNRDPSCLDVAREGDGALLDSAVLCDGIDNGLEGLVALLVVEEGAVGLEDFRVGGLVVPCDDDFVVTGDEETCC